MGSSTGDAQKRGTPEAWMAREGLISNSEAKLGLEGGVDNCLQVRA